MSDRMNPWPSVSRRTRHVSAPSATSSLISRGLFRNEKGEDGIEAEHGKEGGQSGKAAEQYQDEFPRRDLACNHVIHHLHAPRWQCTVDDVYDRIRTNMTIDASPSSCC